MIRTGVYGGSFNPVHNGHTELAKALCDMGAVDEMWLMVSPLNPLKQTGSEMLDDELRLQLTRMAVENDSRISVSDEELHLPRPSYMFRTLEVLRSKFPEREFVLVIGADNWLVFDQWSHYEDILRQHEIIIYPREGYDIDCSALPSNVHLVNTPLIPISSTQIRQAIAAGNCNGEGLAPQVWQTIQDKGYYKK